MWTHTHWKPITTPTTRDLAALNSLYLTNVYEYFSDALDALQGGKYKSALVLIDKAMAVNSKDSQIRAAICTRLGEAASEVLRKADYATAITLLTKAHELESGSESAKTKEHVTKNLHHACLQAGKTKEAEQLEEQNPSLLTASHNSASFLDQYGLKRESLPYYEEALAKSPNDLAIREKFCFLQLLLSRDESNKNNDDEAISLLTRVKSLLQRNMPSPIIEKVMGALSHAYEKNEQYDLADQNRKDVATFRPLPVEETRDTTEDDIAALVSVAKKKHLELPKI